jgi:hypothetical protein
VTASGIGDLVAPVVSNLFGSVVSGNLVVSIVSKLVDTGKKMVRSLYQARKVSSSAELPEEHYCFGGPPC